ncbi:hypothetical protein [Gimesia algae]|uniref:Uncharacterized protein n=1 Tax=Gimesia algae TaxID=2527971 RepID=A0A517VGP3_9PLAN|nr:hypothetical protein [Gimesia algae]QDT92145.1 hypothetical protein Pan161_38110 [Gimesia algae]
MTEKKRIRFISIAGYTILFLLVFYVSSIGPFNAKMMHSVRESLDSGKIDPIFTFDNFDAVYAPLTGAANKIPFLEDLLYDYLIFCSESIYPLDHAGDFELLPVPE